jgi:hypothetical protein
MEAGTDLKNCTIDHTYYFPQFLLGAQMLQNFERTGKCSLTY